VVEQKHSRAGHVRAEHELTTAAGERDRTECFARIVPAQRNVGVIPHCVRGPLNGSPEILSRVSSVSSNKFQLILLIIPLFFFKVSLSIEITSLAKFPPLQAFLPFFFVGLSFSQLAFCL
jgi:hypothetical protein